MFILALRIDIVIWCTNKDCDQNTMAVYISKRLDSLVWDIAITLGSVDRRARGS